MARTYYRDDDEYGQRKRLRVRHYLVKMRQDTINQIRAILAAYQIPAPPDEGLDLRRYLGMARDSPIRENRYVLAFQRRWTTGSRPRGHRAAFSEFRRLDRIPP